MAPKPMNVLRATAATGKEPNQLTQVAVSISGWYLEEPYPDHPLFEQITAWRLSSTPWLTRIKKHKAGEPGVEIFRPERPALQLTEKESQPPVSDRQQSFKIVGYAFPGWLNAKMPDWLKKQQGVGYSMPPDGNVMTWGHYQNNLESPPVFVVSPLGEDPTASVRYYALLQPQDGLCHPYLVKMEEVFFRAEYRDGNSAKKDRLKSWAEKVGVACSGQGDSIPPRTRPRAATGSGKIVFPPYQAFVHELYGLVAALRVNPDRSIYESIVKCMEKALPDLTRTLVPEQPAISAFFAETQEEYPEDLAAKFVTEATILFGPIPDLTPAYVTMLRQCLIDAELRVLFHQLRGFLAEGTFRLSNFGDDLDDQEVRIRLGKEIVDTVCRILPNNRSLPIVMSPENEGKLVLFLQAHLEDLEAMLASFDTYCNEIKEAYGSKATESAGPWDAWRRFADCRDTDSAKLMVQDVAHFVIDSVKDAVGASMVEPLRKRVNLLKLVLRAIEEIRAENTTVTQGKQ